MPQVILYVTILVVQSLIQFKVSRLLIQNRKYFRQVIVNVHLQFSFTVMTLYCVYREREVEEYCDISVVLFFASFFFLL